MMGSFRMGALLISMPVIGPTPIHPIVKFAMAIGMSTLMLPFMGKIDEKIWESNAILMMSVANEIALGMIMGFSARFIFLTVTLALEFSGLQMGFAIASVFDPQNQAQISVVAQLGVILLVLLFFGTSLYRDIFMILVKSFQILPLGYSDWSWGHILKRVISYLSESFQIALRLSLPVMVVMLTVHIIMGVISRTSPQMNLFFNVAFVLNTVVGLIVIYFTLPYIITWAKIFAAKMLKQGFALW